MAVPSELQTAIDNAAAKYGLNPNWLVRIWEFESGGTFPNPAVNSIGCGGLFGLCLGSSNVDPTTGASINLLASNTTQAQADAAAYTLSRLVTRFGNIYDAMIAYSGGSSNEASFVAGATPATASGSGSGSASSGAASGSGASTVTTGLPIVGGVLSGIGDLLGGITSSSILSQIGPALKAYFTLGIFLDPLFVIMGLLFVLIGALGLALGHSDAGQTIKYIGKQAAVQSILG